MEDLREEEEEEEEDCRDTAAEELVVEKDLSKESKTSLLLENPLFEKERCLGRDASLLFTIPRLP